MKFYVLVLHTQDESDEHDIVHVQTGCQEPPCSKPVFSQSARFSSTPYSSKREAQEALKQVNNEAASKKDIKPRAVIIEIETTATT